MWKEFNTHALYLIILIVIFKIKNTSMTNHDASKICQKSMEAPNG